jgi:hypothetical protein
VETHRIVCAAECLLPIDTLHHAGQATATTSVHELPIRTFGVELLVKPLEAGVNPLLAVYCTPCRAHAVLGVYRCGNEAGSRDYCAQHRLHPLYLVLRDQSLSPIDTRQRLAPLLGVAQVGRGWCRMVGSSGAC